MEARVKRLEDRLEKVETKIEQKLEMEITNNVILTQLKSDVADIKVLIDNLRNKDFDEMQDYKKTFIKSILSAIGGLVGGALLVAIGIKIG